MMRQVIFVLGLIGALLAGAAAQAQDRAWVQIEAQPTLREAEDRARAYTGVFPDVAGFQLNSGWYAIVLGPYAPDAAAARLAALRGEGLVPGDSFLADGRAFAQPFWPVGANAALPAPVDPATLPATLPAPATVDPATPAVPPEPAAAPEESAAEARAAEAALAPADREALQAALQWFGFYAAPIDGAFGPGTRKSMAAWQEANAQTPTGILTTTQRTTLLAGYAQAQAELGLQTITEPESGIEITLPLALVQFDRFEPPFVHYSAKAGSGVSLVLISQPGDQATLYGLYDVLQTLQSMPLTGERSRAEQSFTLTGRSATVESHAYAELAQGMVKGYMLTFDPRQNPDRMARVLAAMQASFKPIGDHALDPGLVPMAESTRAGMLSGLEVRRPDHSRSGFYVDAAGMVLTTLEATEGCTRITLDLKTEADVVARDAGLGIAVLRPHQTLAPAAVAEIATGPLRPGSEIAVSGYSYQDTLPAPSLSFGTLDDDKGLNGEAGLARLTLDVLPGDAGGPVFDQSGAVLGMLLPRSATAARQLPAGVSFAALAPALAGKLAEAGIAAGTAPAAPALTPDDLTALAEGMTVLVSCWK